jgi:hypothetical protein
MTTALYNTDFAQWAVTQADHLRNEEYAELDLPNLIEEIEAMAKRDRRDVESRLETILEHALKLRCEPEADAVAGWANTIFTQRNDLLRVLDDNMSLRANIDGFIEKAYRLARKAAARVTRCKIEEFPVDCPWTVEEILDEDWLPG